MHIHDAVVAWARKLHGLGYVRVPDPEILQSYATDTLTLEHFETPGFPDLVNDRIKEIEARSRIGT